MKLIISWAEAGFGFVAGGLLGLLAVCKVLEVVSEKCTTEDEVTEKDFADREIKREI